MSVLLNLASALFDASVEVPSIGSQTGFNSVDVQTATIERSTTGVPILNCGLFPRVWKKVAESGKGKSTFVIQVFCAAADRYEDGMVMYYDPETNTSYPRVKMLTQWSNEKVKRKFKLISGPCSLLRVLNDVLKIKGIKEANKKAIMINSGYVDSEGHPIFIYPPTFMCVDSIPALVSPDFGNEKVDRDGNIAEMESLVGNIDAMQDAKQNTAFVKKIKGYLKDYNIVLCLINHIIEQVSMSMFDKPTKTHPNLKAGQKLKGGSELIYQSHTFTILEKTLDRIDDRNPIYGDEVRGEVCMLRYIKNKAGQSNIEVPMVFDARTGFRPELSDWEFLYRNKYGFTGSPHGYTLDACPSVSFTKKNLWAKCRQYPNLARALSWTAKLGMISQYIFRKPTLPDINSLIKNLSDVERETIITTQTVPYPFYEQYNEEVKVDYFHDYHVHDANIWELLPKDASGKGSMADESYYEMLK